MIEATVFPDAEAAVINAAKPVMIGVLVTNTAPSPITGKLVTVGYSGGGGRDWGEAAVNVGVNVYDQTDKDCRALVVTTQNILASISNDLIEHIQVPAGGGTVVPAQSPPFQRYFVATVWLRPQSLL